MRFATLVLSGLLAIATAQSTTPTTMSTVTSTSSESPAETSQSEVVKCIDACTPGDVACTAKCIAVPNPDAAAANATNECVAACPKGNGTAADNTAYENCVDACIGKYYFTTTSSGASSQATGSSGGGVSVVTTTDSNGSTVTSTSTAAGAGNTQASGTGGGGAKGSSAGSAAPSTATGKSAGEALRAGSAVGLVGVVAAMMAI